RSGMPACSRRSRVPGCSARQHGQLPDLRCPRSPSGRWALEHDRLCPSISASYHSLGAIISHMRIPKYWTRHEGDVSRPDGQSLRLFAWGWSTSSASEAEAKAAERFQSLEQRVRQGLELPRGYAYGDRPVREQIVDQIVGADGHVDALLTRNTYGSIVLN